MSVVSEAVIDTARGDIVEIVGRHVELKKKGSEFVACCPFHEDKSPSFTVSAEKQFYHCFGCGAHGDAIDFVEKVEGVGFREAVERIAGGQISKSAASVRKAPSQKTEPLWSPVVPIPGNAPAPDFVFRGNQATRSWLYRDPTGAPIGYVCRFDLPAGGKDVIPLTYCANTESGELSWRWLSFAKPRPIYGLDKLASHPHAQVVIAEGEKAADAAQVRYEKAGVPRDKLVVISWPGGGKAVKLTDWSALRGRRVGLWPDADQKDYPEGHAHAGQPMPFLEQPGIACMLEIASQIESEVESLKFIMPPEDVADGWDLADDLPAGFDLLEHTKAASMGMADFRAKYMPKEDSADVSGDERELIDLPEMARVTLLQDHDFPDLNKKLKPLNTARNLAALMEHSGISARYNAVSKDVEIEIPGHYGTIENAQNVKLTKLGDIALRCGLSRSNIAEHVKVIADVNTFNPVLEWITSKPWDGISRIDALADTVKCKDHEFFRTVLLRRWLISAVAAVAYEEIVPEGEDPNWRTGFWSKGVLTLQGAQDLGKTSWFRRLAPPHMKVFLDGESLDPTNKDSVMRCVSHWLVELGELDSTLKRDIAALKAFITKREDTLRRPFDRLDTKYPRRTVFCASVNGDKFLRDDTGNGRFWVVEVEDLDHEHDIDVQQVWAEALALYAAGEQWHLKPVEKAHLDTGNERFRQVDPIEELIMASYDFNAPVQRWTTATKVLTEIGFDRPTRSQATLAGNVLKRLDVPSRMRSGRSEYKVPEKLTGSGYSY